MPTLNQHTALLIIDVQKAFDHPGWGRRNNPEAEGNIASLIAHWRGNALPLYHVRHASAFPEGYFQEGQPSFQPKEVARELPHEPVYKKSVNSSFIGTTLEADLRAAGITTLVLVGLTTNHCVSTTARMSGNLGFTTYVVSDATACFDTRGMDGAIRPAEQIHYSALSDLNEEFATIITTRELLAATAAQ